MRKLGKKGVLDQLNGIAIGLVVFLIAIVVGALVIAEVASQAVILNSAHNATDPGTWSTATNTSLETQTQLGSLSDWLGIIVVAAIGAAILGLVMLFRKG